MQRVVIVGTTGAGKTTFGKALAVKIEATFIELDALNWHSGWTLAPNFATKVEQAIEAEHWVVDGNYSKVQPTVLSRADTVVWLDYSIGTKLWRLFKRTCRRTLMHETLWNGNTETVEAQFFSRDSLFVWLFKTHWKKRRRYETLFAEAPPHLTLHRLYEPSEAETLLAETSFPHRAKP